MSPRAMVMKERASRRLRLSISSFMNSGSPTPVSSAPIVVISRRRATDPRCILSGAKIALADSSRLMMHLFRRQPQRSQVVQRAPRGIEQALQEEAHAARAIGEIVAAPQQKPAREGDPLLGLDAKAEHAGGDLERALAK